MSEYDAIAAARASADEDITRGDITNLPPGYVEGFRATLDIDAQVTISGGVTSVEGRQVTLNESHQIVPGDFTGTPLGPYYYYIYLTSSGDYQVDRIKPEYSNQYLYYAHPIFNWQALGRLWVDDADNKIKYVTNSLVGVSNIVTVSPYNTEEIAEGDYLLTGGNDDKLLQAAFDYAGGAFDGGEIQCAPGDYVIQSLVTGKDNVVLRGAGPDTNFVRTMTSGWQMFTPGNDSRVTNLKMSIGSSDTSTGGAFIYDASTKDGVSIDNVAFSGLATTAAINVSSYTKLQVSSCNIYQGSITLAGTSTGTLADIVMDLNNTANSGIIIVDGEFNISNVQLRNVQSVSKGGINPTGIDVYAGIVSIQNCTIDSLVSSDGEGGAPGSKAIFLRSGSAGSIVNGCVINKVWNYRGYTSGVAIDIRDNDVVVTNNKISQCMGGISFSGVTRSKISNNTAFDIGQVILFGDCSEGANLPRITGQAGPNQDNCTATVISSSPIPYLGSGALKINKDTAAAGGHATYYFHDHTDSTYNDLAGLIAGVSYVANLYMNAPAAIAVANADFVVEYSTDGASWGTVNTDNVTANDAWEALSIPFTLPATATGVAIYCRVDTSEAQNDYIAVDQVRIYEPNQASLNIYNGQAFAISLGSVLANPQIQTHGNGWQEDSERGYELPKKFTISGAASDIQDGPHQQFKINTDKYYTAQFLNWAHDTIGLSFDSYYDGTNWISSDAGSNFLLYKNSDILQFQQDSSIAQGSTITWNTVLAMDTIGNIGIGIAAPAAQLHLYRDDTDTATGSFRIEQDGTGDAFMHFSLTGGVAYALGIDNSDGDKLKLGYHATAESGVATGTMVTVDTAGNVGIGTTSPTHELNVVGDVNITNDLILGASTQDYLFTDRAERIVLQAQTSGTNSILEMYSKDGDATDSVGIAFWSKGLPGSVVDRERLTMEWHSANSQYEIATEAGGTGTLRDIVLYTEGNANQLVIDAGGNVGIGTASPTAKLHVDQASTTAAIPVLTLDQADISEEMIEFVTTIGVGNAIEAIAAKALTTTHFIKVTIPGGLTRYIPCGTIA